MPDAPINCLRGNNPIERTTWKKGRILVTARVTSFPCRTNSPNARQKRKFAILCSMRPRMRWCKAYHYDAVWRAKALKIGSSGRRCHDLQFTSPRYIVTCERYCWVATAERRKRGVICKRCQGQVVYNTYTKERWNNLNTTSS